MKKKTFAHKKTIIPRHTTKRGALKSKASKVAAHTKTIGLAGPYQPIPSPTIEAPINVGGIGCDKKIAFIFLTIESLHQGQVWWQFLKKGGNRCNVYAHSKFPQFIKQKFLRESQIKHIQNTHWAHVSLVKATNNLIASALADPTNAYIMLVSEKCMPLYDFDTVYDYICGHDKSHIFHYHWGGKPGQNQQRYNSLMNQEKSKAVPKNMGLNLKLHQFLKQSQWMLLRRDHAEFLNINNYTPLFNKMPAPDEHYYINVLRHKFPLFDQSNVNYPITFVNWKESPRGNHPLEYKKVSLKHIRSLHSPKYFKTGGHWEFGKDKDFKSMFMRKITWKTKIIKK